MGLCVAQTWPYVKCGSSTWSMDGSSLVLWYSSARPRSSCFLVHSQPAVCSPGPGFTQASASFEACRLVRAVPYWLSRSVCPPDPPAFCGSHEADPLELDHLGGLDH